MRAHDLTCLVAGGSILRREGLARLLADVPEVGIITRQKPGATVAEAVAYARPDVVFVPLRQARTRRTGLARLARRVRVIVVADGRVRHRQIVEMARLRVAGVLDGASSLEVLAEAVRSAVEDVVLPHERVVA